jgi:hypothetical protein
MVMDMETNECTIVRGVEIMARRCGNHGTNESSFGQNGRY